MNDEQFELTINDLARSGIYYADIADELRARDTAQREAVEAWKAAHAREATALAQAWEQRDAAQAQLAKLQAEMPDLRANMTKALDLLQVLTSTKYTDRAFVEAVDETDEMLEQLRGKVVLQGPAEQQEARGTQAVDETQEYILRAMGLNYSDRHSWDKLDTAAVIKAADEIARLRAALATRPAAGEPEQQTAINADDLPTKKYPLGAFDFAAPVAAGEPIQVEAVAVTREDGDGLHLDWVLEGGISALEAPGVVLLVAHGTVTDDQGSGEVYLSPPAAAHGDEAVRKDAERYQALRNTPEIFIGVAEGDDMVFLKSPEQLDQLADNAAAMRAQAGEWGEV